MTLADDLLRGKIDIAFLRREQEPDLDYKLVGKEPLVAIMPAGHPAHGAQDRRSPGSRRGCPSSGYRGSRGSSGVSSTAI
ncbi:MAG: LysR substrate-binding domain-containing protein [Pseudomonadota bacterium]